MFWSELHGFIEFGAQQALTYVKQEAGKPKNAFKKPDYLKMMKKYKRILYYLFL